MSETKRVALTTLSTNKCDKKSGKNFGKTVRLNISLIEPNEHSCSVFDYTTLLNTAEKKRLKKKQQQSDSKVNGAVDPFDDEDDEDVKRIARQFEEKYGGSDRQKQNRCQTYSELGAGYDENDSFIDNTDACDEALPEEMQTVHGGYYVNSGPLEFKRVEFSDADDLDDFKGKKRKFTNVIRDDTESEDEADNDDDEDGDDEDEDDEDEDEEEEIEEEIIGKENGEPEKVEEKVEKDKKDENNPEDLSPAVVKKMKIVEKPEDKQEPIVTTKTEPIVLNHEETGNVKKKRKKRTLTVAERAQLLEEQLYEEEVQAQDIVNSSVTVPTIPLQTVGNASVNNSNKHAAVTSANSSIPSVTLTVTKTSNNSSVTVTAPLSSNSVIGSNSNNVNNSNASSRTSSPTNSSAVPQQNSSNSSSVKQNKKKSMTVKALLEEKRGSNPNETGNTQPVNENAAVTSTAVPVATTNSVVATSAGVNGNSVTSVEVKKPVSEHTSVNDVIEYVISSARDGDSSKDSSSSTSKSQSGTLLVCTDSDLSTESSDSQINKPTQPTNPSVLKPMTSNEIPPIPDNLPNDILDLINNIKLSSRSDIISKRNFPDDLNNMLLSLEKKSQTITSANRNIIYEHLAGFLPCSKFTLVKRVKKLFFDSVEDEMNEPIKRLKTTIDTVMPSLLERYSKDCQSVAADKSNNEPPSTDASGEAITKIGSKVPRRKFIWNNEMRLCVREIIELRNQCFLIKNPRRETRDAYISSFLASKIQPLWPPGWMKTSTLLREAGEIQTARKKKGIPTISPTCLPSQQAVRSQSPQQGHSQQHNQQKSPIQSLLNVSLPSSTTLTPAVIGSSTSIGYNSKLQDRSNHNHSKRSPVSISSSQLTVSVSSPSNTNSHGLRPSEPSVSVLSRPATSVTSHQTPSKALKSNPITPSPAKKQSISPNSNNNHSINSAPNPGESQNSMKEQFPLYNLVKNQSSSSFKINNTEIEVLNTANSVKNENPLILSAHKSDKKYTNRKFDISANNSSSSISLLSSNNKKESNNSKQERDRQNIQSVLMSSDLSLNSGVAAGINLKSNKNGDKVTVETVNNVGGGSSKKNKSPSDIENKNKSNLITLNGSPMSFPPSSSSTVNSNPKIKREIKTEDLNVNVNNCNKDVNIDCILDLSSSNCASLRTENNSNTNSVNKLNNNSKSVIKNVTSVNERTAHINSGVVYTSETRMSVVSSKTPSSSQDLTVPNNREQKSTSISPGNTSSNTSSSSSNKKLTNQSSTPVRSLKQRILQDQQMSTSANLERNLKRSLDDKNDNKTNVQSNQSSNAQEVKKKVKIDLPPLKIKVEPSSPVKSSPSPAVTNKQSEVVVHTSPPEEMGSIQQHVLLSPLDGSDRDTSNNKDRRSNSSQRHQRLPSGDQDAKMQMEVDQVIQDLAMLREMSGCGPANNVDEVSSHKSASGHKTMSSSSPFFSSSSCSSTSSYSLASDTKKPSQTVSSYQNEFYKHLMQKESASPPPSIVYIKQENTGRLQSFQNSPYTSDNIEDIPNKYSSISLHSVSGQGKQNSQGNPKQSQLNQQSPTSVGQSMPHLSPGVIQHHSSSYDHSPPSSHYQQQQHHINLHSQSVLSARNSKNEDYHSLLTKSSPKPYNQFDWSLTGNNHQPSPQ